MTEVPVRVHATDGIPSTMQVVTATRVHPGSSNAVRADNDGRDPVNAGSPLRSSGQGSYGSITDDNMGSQNHSNVNAVKLELKPLITDIPPEITTVRSRSNSLPGSFRFPVSNRSVGSVIDSIFSDVRSEDESSRLAIQNESELYNNSNIFARAFPDRFLALLVTLVLELPVLLMISGGSDALCELIGRSRYQLLVGFLPLSSAISGNVGLQASSLTTRAISHEQVTSSSYLSWFGHEIGAAICLSLGMGSVLGTMAFVASGLDYAFAVTIMIAQCLSVLTAGVTGTFAPLLFSFVCNRDSGKWAGPIETTIQDIVGSFAMVVISYKILLWIGPGPIDPGDYCVADS